MIHHLDDLNTFQEEADTRVIMHAFHAARSGYNTVVIVSEDTDVFVLLLAFKQHLMPCSVLIKTGTQNRVTYIDVSKVFESIGQNVCEALPGLHAYTGCDTVSAFAGKGKLAAYRALAKSTEFQNTFKQLGMEWDLPDDVYRSSHVCCTSKPLVQVILTSCVTDCFV